MPALLMSSGLLPVMSLPSSTMLPSVGRYMPVSMLKTVVLPSRLGPIRPYRWPFSMVRANWGTACSPPKAMTRVFTSSNAILRPVLGLYAQSLADATLFHQPLAPGRDLRALVEDHQDDQHDGVNQHPVIVQAAEHLGQNGQQRRRDDRPPHASHAAQHHKHQDLDG